VVGDELKAIEADGRVLGELDAEKGDAADGGRFT
jgi:hypothetical protein